MVYGFSCLRRTIRCRLRATHCCADYLCAVLVYFTYPKLQLHVHLCREVPPYRFREPRVICPLSTLRPAACRHYTVFRANYLGLVGRLTLHYEFIFSVPPTSDAQLLNTQTFERIGFWVLF